MRSSIYGKSNLPGSPVAPDDALDFNGLAPVIPAILANPSGAIQLTPVDQGRMSYDQLGDWFRELERIRTRTAP
jgi:hypothetical protein